MGIDKLREQVEQIRGNDAAKKETAAMEVAKTLESVRNNEKLAALYRENVNVGTEDLGGQSPLLKVHTTNKSTANQLADGTEPNNGWFFYKPTGEQFKEVVCHILTISKGFRAKDMNGNDKWNQLLAGVIEHQVEGKVDYKPFVMYVTGTKLSKMWEFGKEAKQYTHAKPVGIPMFALSVKLTTEIVKSDFGNNWVVNFEILKNEDGTPVLVTDEGVFVYLRDSVASVQDTIASIIDAKATEEQQEVIEPIEGKTEIVNEDKVDVADLPF